MEFASRLGLRYVEASADTEADPLYCGPEYLDDWVAEVSRCESETGVKVANLYSGHGTYATLGLLHPDERVRRRMLDLWVKPMIRAAASLDAGLGFYCHAFADPVLQNPESYAAHLRALYGTLAEAAVYAAQQGATTLGIEQMYSPHQFPWTIDGARDLIREVSRRAGVPLYLTIDTGHQTGQGRFLRPTPIAIAEQVRRQTGAGKIDSGTWVGSADAQARLEACERERAISEEDLAFLARDMDRHPFLFSLAADADTYGWLEALGCFSPIVHLQQVSGSSSLHLPFTPETNSTGLIHPTRVLRALKTCYDCVPAADLPQRVRSIYLTLEIFPGAAQTRREIERNLSMSVEHWRVVVPEDGSALDRLVDALPDRAPSVAGG